MKKIKSDLPDKPSELLLLALEDLEAVEQDPAYLVDMRHWASRNRRYTQECSVCLAGSVMVKRLIPKQYLNDLDSFQFEPINFHRGFLMGCEDVANKLYAINFFRIGAVEAGLTQLGLSVNESTRARFRDFFPDKDSQRMDDLSSSERTREHWRLNMLTIVGVLQAEGL